MTALVLALVIVAFICEIVAAVPVAVGRVNLIAAGLAFGFLAYLVTVWP